MEPSQSIENFYKTKVEDIPANLNAGLEHFNVFRLDEYAGVHSKPVPYSRKDFFKVSLIVGKNNIYYADKSIVIQEQAILFANPHIPYSWDFIDEKQTGFFCIFSKDFFNQFGAFKEYPMFQPDGNPIIEIKKEQIPLFESIFLKMFQELDSDYPFKYDAIRNQIFEIIHLSLKLQPTLKAPSQMKSNGTERVSSLFMDLLERQFPIEDLNQTVSFRSPSEFANQLNIHVNHLNKALKETTGKTTSGLISERIVQESKILLKQTTWNVNEIARCLGFEELSHFINFFRKAVHKSPKAYRLESII
ncbi:helix-turn-helix transcriptional regulator [Flavobacterium sp.]|uniref:helix-turn-helix domain-containing protein n=1 Tax=Flavobacterium sp. TaxID=239 RepID=UPI00121B3987|nr:helix-turn-helix transcriptional regulator [Flavobacterium sp.]RZJ73073.1 MAG: AraC family transcriptional regulator [Flavobacterium sp.]